MSNFKSKLSDKTAVIGVVGLGYVGLPLAVEAAKAGFAVIGIDVSSEKCEMLSRGENYIGDVKDSDLRDALSSGKLRAVTDFSEVSKTDFVCIAVPTPLDIHQQPDISYVKSSCESILAYLHKDMAIILESTTYPGTTEELLLPMFESTGLKCGDDFHLAFSPERVDPGNQHYNTGNTIKVVGGVTPECTDIAAAMYESILNAPIHKVSSPAVAEMEKILENAYRNVNIGLINELAILCNRMSISIWEVIDAAKTKPYGFHAFYPGPGLGGHCIPLDPYYLSWKAREFGFHTSMIETSMVVNDGMPEYCVMRASRVLNKDKKALNGSKILLLGVAYKQDIDDYRESPALRVYKILRREGADVCFYDPFVAEFRNGEGTVAGESNLTPELLQSVDLVMITTGHTNVDYDLVAEHSKAIFDTRNAMKNVAGDRLNIEVL